MSTVVAGSRLPEDDKSFGGQLVHYGVGAMLGVAYGVAAELLPPVTFGGGAAFATAAWALLDETTVPAAEFGDPPWKSPPGSQAFGIASHIVFGLTAEMTRRIARHAVAGPEDGTPVSRSRAGQRAQSERKKS